MRRSLLLSILALGHLVAQPNRAPYVQSPIARCNSVAQLVRLLQAAKISIPPDINTANDTCRQTSAALRNPYDPERTRQAIANAGSVLDQLGLTAQALYTRLSEAASAVDPRTRNYALTDLAKLAFNLGFFDDAEAYARELLTPASQNPRDWNYGNSIYYGNFVLGRLALRRGDVQLAGQYLLDAGKTPGSPQLNTFGPNLMLAKELLEKGQSAAVLQFFSECKNFWKMDKGKLDEWSATIRGGGVPQITQNLNY